MSPTLGRSMSFVGAPPRRTWLRPGKVPEINRRGLDRHTCPWRWQRLRQSGHCASSGSMHPVHKLQAVGDSCEHIALPLAPRTWSSTGAPLAQGTAGAYTSQLEETRLRASALATTCVGHTDMHPSATQEQHHQRSRPASAGGVPSQDCRSRPPSAGSRRPASAGGSTFGNTALNSTGAADVGPQARGRPASAGASMRGGIPEKTVGRWIPFEELIAQRPRSAVASSSSTAARKRQSEPAATSFLNYVEPAGNGREQYLIGPTPAEKVSSATIELRMQGMEKYLALRPTAELPPSSRVHSAPRRSSSVGGDARA